MGIALLAVVCLVGAPAAIAQPRAPDPQNWRQLDPENTLYIDTVHGRIVVEMYPEAAPRHVDEGQNPVAGAIL